MQAAEFDALICIPQSRTIKVLYHPHEGIPNSSLCCLLKNNSNRHPPLIDKISGSKTKEFGKAYLNPRKLYSRFESYIQEYLDRQKDYLKDYIKDLNERKGNFKTKLKVNRIELKFLRNFASILDRKSVSAYCKRFFINIKHMLFTFRDKIGLQADKLSPCYLKSLETLIEAIKNESLPMFFMPNVNLLENKFDDKEARKV